MCYGVLVVDDSAFMRKSISQIIEKNPKFQVVGIARNGSEVVEKVKRLHPAVVTMDVEMPEMDGLSAVEALMRECPVPVVMLSSITMVGKRTTIRALELGAVDCVHKDELLNAPQSDYRDFYGRLEAAANAKIVARVLPEANIMRQTGPQRTTQKALTPEKTGPVDLIVIGCSTGGPAALQSILPRFSDDLNVPVLVIQHMPPGFTKSLAERFDTICRVPVKEAQDGEVLRKGWIYVAPAGVQTLLTRKGMDLFVQLSVSTQVETRFRPSVDVTLLSVSPVVRERLLVVILTGMGNDGTLGCKDVKRFGGKVLVQSEETCVVYGMPKSVFEAGYADLQTPLENISDQIANILA